MVSCIRATMAPFQYSIHFMFRDTLAYHVIWSMPIEKWVIPEIILQIIEELFL
jgi:hypothetical protein